MAIIYSQSFPKAIPHISAGHHLFPFFFLSCSTCTCTCWPSSNSFLFLQLFHMYMYVLAVIYSLSSPRAVPHVCICDSHHRFPFSPQAVPHIKACAGPHLFPFFPQLFHMYVYMVAVIFLVFLEVAIRRFKRFKPSPRCTLSQDPSSSSLGM